MDVVPSAGDDGCAICGERVEECFLARFDGLVEGCSVALEHAHGVAVVGQLRDSRHGSGNCRLESGILPGRCGGLPFKCRCFCAALSVVFVFQMVFFLSQDGGGDSSTRSSFSPLSPPKEKLMPPPSLSLTFIRGGAIAAPGWTTWLDEELIFKTTLKLHSRYEVSSNFLRCKT